MSLSSLPAELILMIAENLESEKAINSLTRTNRFFYSLLNPFLYRSHARNNVWLSALQHAAKRNLPGVIEHLVNAGVSLHSREAWFYHILWKIGKPDCYHPLVSAAGSGHANVMEILLDQEGLTSGLTEEHFSGMMYWAARNSHTEVVKVMLDRKLLGPWRVDAGNFLYDAAEDSCIDIVNLLLNDADERTKTGLLSATVRQRELNKALLGGMRRQNSEDIITLLLKAGADVNFVSEPAGTPLGQAAYYKHVGAVKLLLEAEANPNILECRKWGPLARAMQRRVDESGWSGLSSWNPPGHDPEDPDLQTPPHQMSTFVREIFRLLFEYGAEPSRAGGSWALHRAIYYQCHEAAHLLCDKGTQITTSLVHESRQGVLNQAVADRGFAAIKAMVPEVWSRYA